MPFSQRDTKQRHIGRCEEEERGNLVIKNKYLRCVLFVYADEMKTTRIQTRHKECESNLRPQ